MNKLIDWFISKGVFVQFCIILVAVVVGFGLALQIFASLPPIYFIVGVQLLLAAFALLVIVVTILAFRSDQ